MLLNIQQRMRPILKPYPGSNVTSTEVGDPLLKTQLLRDVSVV